MKLLFLDIETTGFSREWNEIIELAAILYDTEKQETIDSFHQYAKPAKGVPANITEITGITNEQLKNSPSEKEMMLDFCNWCDDIVCDGIVGHNCKAFDLQFIDAKCNRYHYNWMKSPNIIDTLSLARQMKKSGLLNLANLKQTTLAEHFNITYQAHSALEDVKALILIYNKMIDYKPKRETLGF